MSSRLKVGELVTVTAYAGTTDDLAPMRLQMYIETQCKRVEGNAGAAVYRSHSITLRLQSKKLAVIKGKTALQSVSTSA